jgi:hypothetical protein
VPTTERTFAPRRSGRPLPRWRSAVFSFACGPHQPRCSRRARRLRVFSEHGCEVSCERHVRAFWRRQDSAAAAFQLSSTIRQSAECCGRSSGVISSIDNSNRPVKSRTDGSGLALAAARECMRTRDVYLHSIPADARAAVQKVEDFLIRPKLTQDVEFAKTGSSLFLSLSCTDLVPKGGNPQLLVNSLAAVVESLEARCRRWQNLPIVETPIRNRGVHRGGHGS